MANNANSGNRGNNLNRGNNGRNASGNNFSTNSFTNNSFRTNNNSRNISSNVGNNSNRGNKANNRGNNKANNRGNKANNKGSMMGKLKDKSSIFVIVGVVLLLIILAVAGYFIYKYMKAKTPGAADTKQFIPYIHDASIEKRISHGSIPQSSQGNEYNMNFWIYVNDYGVRKPDDKCIIYKGERPAGELNNAGVDSAATNQNTACNPGIWLLKNVNTFRVIIGLDTVYGASPCQSNPVCGSGALDIDYCDIENFPLQRWVNVNVALHNNVLDVFFDGALKKSTILKGAPLATTGDLLICPSLGFNGYLSNMKYSNVSLGVDKIMAMYKAGPTL